MNRLDKEILMSLLSSQQSMYGLEKSIEGTNYATVYRRIKRMQKEGLLTSTNVLRKNGKQDARGTQKPELTTKGLATLIVDGELQKEELLTVTRKVLKTDYDDLSASFLAGSNIDEIFANLLLKMRHKINLKFFDEEYFNRTFNISFFEALITEMKKHDFQKETSRRAEARKIGKKYVSSSQIEGMKKLRQQFAEEKNEMVRNIAIIDEFIKAMEKLRA